MRVIAMLMVLLAGCSGAGELPQPKGPVFPLNTARWVPVTSDLAIPARQGLAQ